MSLVRLCDFCGEQIKDSDVSNERERVEVVVALGWEGDAVEVAREYHRKCARELTVPAVYAKTGLLPL